MYGGMIRMSIVDKVLKKRGVDVKQLKSEKAKKLNFPELDEVVNYMVTNYFMKEVGKTGVFYDVDVDGLMSGYTLEDFLNRMGKSTVNYINPMKEHGLTEKSLEWVREEKLDWLFIVDAGSDDFDKMVECLAMGTKVVVLDHHPYTERVYPEGIWVVNISKYDNLPKLSGCGVVYRYIEMLGELFDMETTQYETFVGITVISDMCSMADAENRYYVERAYEGYRDNVFLKKFKLYGSLKSFYGWGVIPYLNALIRTGEEKRAVMVVNNMNRYAKMNRIPDDVKRVKNRQKDMMGELFGKGKISNNGSVVMHLRHGIDELRTLNGLVANGLISEYGHSALVMAYDMDKKMWRGSFRGSDFDRSVLNEWGFWTKGHPKACGVKIRNRDLKKFHKNFVNKKKIKKDKADIYVNAGELSKDDWLDIAQFNEYSGVDMPEIVVAYKKGTEEVIDEYEEWGLSILRTKDGEVKDFSKSTTEDLHVIALLDSNGYQHIRT